MSEKQISNVTHSLYFPSCLLGIIILLIGVTVVIGWVFGIQSIITPVLPHWYVTKPIAGINIALTGASIILWSFADIKKMHESAVFILTLLILVITGLNLFFAMFPESFSLAVPYFTKNAELYNLFDLMPPTTAFCFILIGFSLLCLVLKSSPRVKLPILFSFSCVIFIIGLMIFQGYVADYFFSVHSWDYAGVGMQTPVAFLLIGTALFLLAKKEGQFIWSLDGLSTIAFFMGIVALFVVAATSEHSIKRLVLHVKQVSSVEEALNQLGELQSNFLNYLSIERIYVITGNQNLLNEQAVIKNELRTNLREFQQQIKNNESLSSLFNQAAPYIDQKIALIDKIIEVRKSKGMQASIDFLMHNGSIELSSKIDSLLSELRKEAYKKLKDQLAVETSTSDRVYKFLPIETFLSLTILLLGVFFLNQRIFERKVILDQKRKLESQLRQSQKMQAIGQLTGGIAHDFNNLLGIIIGNLDFLQDMFENNEAALKKVKPASNAALRGAEITKRLLSFSRFEQLNPTSVSINESVQNAMQMISRSLGPDIKVIQKLDPSNPIVFIDETEFQNVLVNLSVNARDAMPKGGTLTIITETKILEEDYPAVQAKELKPGTYARITVSDTGQGMPAAVIERAFEPFYTTKPMGKGTGLGLAMVYGFAKQSNGYVKIYSEVNEGTSIVIELPLSEKVDSVKQAVKEKEIVSVKLKGLALVVDDEIDLAEIASLYLKEMGLEVLQAIDAKTALKTLEDNPNISLLITDIIMPGGMNGVELSEIARTKKPDLIVVYVSGFHGESLAEKLGKNVDVPFLRKPYQKREFFKTIQEAVNVAIGKKEG